MMTDLARAIEAVEHGLLNPRAQADSPLKKMELVKRMAHYKVPGVSVALVDQGELAWARGYGEMEAGSGKAVTPETIFQAASISKTITGLVALHLVENGTLDLDADVNDFLRSWKVPKSKHTQERTVTLRGLLSHTAGMGVQGYPGYPAGSQLPTLLQILDGRPPALPKPVRVVQSPGKEFIYSGGGYLVAQQMIEDVTGIALPELVQEWVLDRLEMANSSFTTLLPEKFLPQAATAHLRTGDPVPGKWHLYPEQAAACLWTTPSDLAAPGRRGITIVPEYIQPGALPGDDPPDAGPPDEPGGIGFQRRDQRRVDEVRTSGLERRFSQHHAGLPGNRARVDLDDQWRKWQEAGLGDLAWPGGSRRVDLVVNFLSARWQHLLLANYSIQAEILAPFVPVGTKIDVFNGHVFVSLVAFMFERTRVLGLPIPYHINFEEVNLRFYVTPFKDPSRRAVTFIKEIVPKKAIPIITNRFFAENYVALPMSHQASEFEHAYSWKNGSTHTISGRITSQLAYPAAGSIGEFITEHYWGYAKGSNKTLEYRVTHPQWKCCVLDEYDIKVDFAQTYGERFGFLSHQQPVNVLYAEGSEVQVSFPKRISI